MKVHIEGFERPAVEPEGLPDAVLVRRATGRDIARICVLAQLDSRRLPVGPFVLAELSGHTLAAISLSTGEVVADPFQPTAHAVELLRLRAAQLGGCDELTAARRQRDALRPAAA